MASKRHGGRGALTVLLACVLIGAGCSSLKPSASMVPPERGGGVEISDDGRDVAEVFGFVLYILGPFLADSSSCHK